MFLPDRTHKMLILLNFAQKCLSFHPTPLAFGRIFTHGAGAYHVTIVMWVRTSPVTRGADVRMSHGWNVQSKRGEDKLKGTDIYNIYLVPETYNP